MRPHDSPSDIALLLRRLIVGDLMIASQGGAIWLWIVSRPFGWWPTLKMAFGPRVRMYLEAGTAVFVPSRTATKAAGTAGEHSGSYEL